MSSGLVWLWWGRGVPILSYPPWVVQRPLGLSRFLDLPCTLHNFWGNSSGAARCDEGLEDACEQVGESSSPEPYNIIHGLTFVARKTKAKHKYCSASSTRGKDWCGATLSAFYSWPTYLFSRFSSLVFPSDRFHTAVWIATLLIVTEIIRGK